MPGLDVRVNTGFLSDPVRLRLSAEANMALIAMQCYALSHITDGYVEAAALAVGPRWQGIPWVDEGTLAELEEAGLAERDATGVQVTWEWQSYRKEREEKRANSRERSQRYRNNARKDRAFRKAVEAGELPSIPSHLGVTRDERVSSPLVGKDRHRKGETTGDSTTPSRTPAGTTEQRSSPSNVSSSIASIQAVPTVEGQEAFRLPGVPLLSSTEEERVRKRSLVAELHAQGFSVREIGERTGMSKSAVHRRVQSLERGSA